ncbi:MAG TPA: fumarate/nitrate reduction transcriptional regulator Fnr [Gammaproteobacteria bacterium]|nr:fumarate/nitrate reduction transcriptional regulator Fnr [Gammaproteobacteria bacterium]
MRFNPRPATGATAIVSVNDLKVACKNCSLFQLCLPVGMEEADLEALNRIIERRRPMKRGHHLYRIGDSFQAIYAVRSGSIKTYTVSAEGQEQVTGFHLAGELLGLDAINDGQHPCNAKVLESTAVCEIPFDRLDELCDRIPGLRRQLFKVMSKELSFEQSLLTLLGKKNSQERLAAFLLSLSARYRSRGFSPQEFRLGMSRDDIGNYLGLAMETVSRMFTRFQTEGILKVDNRNVRILDLERLQTLAHQDGRIPISA